MRIGIDARLWNETGVGRYIKNLVEYLAQIDKQNEYVLFIRNKENFQFPISNFQSNRWKIVAADMQWHSIDEQVRFPAILEKEKLDLMHFPYFSVPIFYKGKFVVTIHDLIPLHVNTRLATTLPAPIYKAKRIGYKVILKQATKKASKIIAVSQATKDEVVKYLHVDSEKVVVTYEGLDKKLSNTKKQTATMKNSYFLYVGNAYPHKNLERLIEAFNLVVKKEPSTKLLLTGKEDYFYKRLHKKVKELHLSESIIFYGQVTDSELANLYSNAQGLVVPSLMEGFGLPALEAMANRCLVVASDIPSLREICKEAAVYFNPYDTDDIAEKLLKVRMDEGDLEIKRKEGMVRAKEFSWEKMAKETLRIYEEVIR